MGLMSMCPACGSDWCSGCDCVRTEMQKTIDALRADVQRMEAEVQRLTEERDDANRRQAADRQSALANWAKYETEKARADAAELDRDRWRDAVIDASVVNWTYKKSYETDPKGAIDDLIAQVMREALDPVISTGAAELTKRAEQAEADLAAERTARAQAVEAAQHAFWAMLAMESLVAGELGPDWADDFGADYERWTEAKDKLKAALAPPRQE